MKTRLVAAGWAAIPTVLLLAPLATFAGPPTTTIMPWIAPQPCPPPTACRPPDLSVGGTSVYHSCAKVEPASNKTEKLRIRIPFTPTNEDGTPGKRVLLTIKIEAESHEQALDIADEITDRLVVQPNLDDVWDEIDRHILEILRTTQSPVGEAIPPALEVLPMPTPTPATDDESGQASGTEPTNVAEVVEDTLQAFDWVGSLLGLRVSLGNLAWPLHLADDLQKAGPGDARSADPNERMRELLNESENIGQIQKEWERLWSTDQPSHLTHDRIQGGIGP
jgi:hypothetical protein